MSYFVANWKMHGSDKLAQELALAAPKNTAFSKLILCPPYLYVKQLAGDASFEVGGQNCSEFASGAHTGEVSAEMLKEAGCFCVILGHSERRAQHDESNALVRAKAERAIEAGLVPIICVGESLAEREAGYVLETLEKQVKESLPESANSANTIIAYEPIWAIGTGNVATLDQIEAVHQHLKLLNSDMPLLYGGSVKPANVDEICAVQGVDGVLVGGASIDPAQFSAMITKRPA